MPALEPLPGLRVVADPAAVDAARWSGEVRAILRIAPDEAFAIGADGVDLGDEHAIAVDEIGFVGGRVDLDALRPHIEWPVPTERPALAQGSIAGVPARLWLDTDDGRAFLVVHAAYAADLLDRLGWST